MVSRAADVLTVFLDTNVLIYGVDNRDIGKRDRARQWVAACWQRRCGRLSTQVLNEFYVNVRRKFSGQMSRAEAQAEIRLYQQWKPWTIDQATVETAWAVESRFGLNYWDALMLAAAQHQGCTLLISEDMQHGQQVDGVRIVNPFVSGPEVLEAAG